MFKGYGLEDGLHVSSGLNISPSLVRQFHEPFGGCPFSFNLSVNLGVNFETPFWLKMVFNRGTILHNTYQHYFDVITFDELLENYKRGKLSSYIEDVLTKLLNLSLSQTFLWKTFVPALYDCLPLLVNFEISRFEHSYQKFKKKGRKYIKKSYMPIAVEKRLYNEKYRLAGKLDFLGLSYNRDLKPIKYIRDLKTSHFDFDDIPYNKFQLAFYSLLVKLDKKKEPLIRKVANFLARSGKDVFYVVSNTYLKKVIRLINGIRLMMINSEFPRRSNCNPSCDYYETCKEYFDKTDMDVMVKEISDIPKLDEDLLKNIDLDLDSHKQKI